MINESVQEELQTPSGTLELMLAEEIYLKVALIPLFVSFVDVEKNSTGGSLDVLKLCSEMKRHGSVPSKPVPKHTEERSHCSVAVVEFS